MKKYYRLESASAQDDDGPAPVEEELNEVRATLRVRVVLLTNVLHTAIACHCHAFTHVIPRGLDPSRSVAGTGNTGRD